MFYGSCLLHEVLNKHFIHVFFRKCNYFSNSIELFISQYGSNSMLDTLALKQTMFVHKDNFAIQNITIFPHIYGS